MDHTFLMEIIDRISLGEEKEEEEGEEGGEGGRERSGGGGERGDC